MAPLPEDDEQPNTSPVRPVADETCSLLKARQKARCGRCKYEIWPGDMVRWAPGRRSIHATPEGCSKAADDYEQEDPLRRFWDFSVEDAINKLGDAEERGKRPGTPRTELAQARRKEVIVKRDERKKARAALTAAERWHRFERLGAILLARDWHFARTMPTNPHWYSRRINWPNQDEFVFCVETLRLLGYGQKFGSMWYTAIDVNDHFYWTMGWPVYPERAPRSTALINRKPDTGDPVKLAARGTIGASATYNASETAKVVETIGNLSDRAVLDVGCATSGVLDFLPDVSRYVGIDPCHAELEALRQRHPDAHLVWTTLSSFVPVWPTGITRGGPHDALLQRPRDSHVVDTRFDVILALFGAGASLNSMELERIPLLLRPGGRAWVMFEKGWRSDDADASRWHSLDMPPGEVLRMDHHTLYCYEKPSA